VLAEDGCDDHVEAVDRIDVSVGLDVDAPAVWTVEPDGWQVMTEGALEGAHFAVSPRSKMGPGRVSICPGSTYWIIPALLGRPGQSERSITKKSTRLFCVHA
jgi:hypothetical protein